MGRTAAVIISVAVTATVCAAGLIVLRLLGASWRGFTRAVSRLLRGPDEHPQFELLAQ